MARTPITAPTTPTKKTGKAKSFVENNSRAKALHRIVAAQTAFKPASEVLLKVRAVPTPFVQVDRLTRCGGWPVERVSVIHGPSNDGKSTFLLGLGRGFLERGHIFAFIDAEHATPMDYVAKILGPYADSPNFIAMRPDSYEGTIDAVSSLCKSFETERGTGELDAMTTGLIGLDSIKKLVPKRILAALLNGAEATKGRGKQAKEVGVDGMRGMAAMYKAALNTQWMDQLVPQLARSGLGIAIIARETVEESDDFFGQEKVTLGGGAALNFDASLRVRVSVAKNLVDDEKNLIGVRHAVEVFKTKIGTREKKRPVGFFHTSTGLVTPEGLDRARDLIEIGTELDVVTLKGSWYSFDGEKLGQGEDGAAFKLSQSEDWMARIERAVRDAYAAESSVPR
jgi:recombination protein RecA